MFLSVSWEKQTNKQCAVDVDLQLETILLLKAKLRMEGGTDGKEEVEEKKKKEDTGNNDVSCNRD